MTDMRRTVLWMVFTMSLVLIWDAWNRHTGQPSFFGPPVKTATAPAGAPPATPASVALPAPVGATAATASPAPSAAVAPTATAAPGQLIDISTDRVKARFDTVGGNLVRLELLGQKDALDPKLNVLLFDRSAERVYTAQSGLVGAPGLPNHLTAMRWVDGPKALADGSKTLPVRFDSVDNATGVKLAKTYTFTRGDYVIGVKHEVSNNGTAAVTPSLYLGLERDGNAARGESKWYLTFTGPAVYTEAKKYEKVAFSDIEKGKTSHHTSASDGWVAMVQHYFASAWLVPGNAPREFSTAKVSDNLYRVTMGVGLGTVAPGQTVTHDAQLFAGPQEEKILEALAPGLDLVKDYGWFTFLSKPLFWLLDYINSVLHNWGWSIVALVVLLKIAFYWLNASAYRSMANMKKMAPRVTELRERYKDKPQLMQQEMMRIYREEKVNPLGGCLPIVAQMPFFIALYWVLLSSVEMRNAPWIGWIKDLATPDPWFILPLLMMASSLFQVWLQPSAADPMQQKMMWFMPVAFGFMFFFFPAGLVLYWLTNNILSIAQQWWINKRLGVG
jgi:YidC/Oxa1 family membrane protein insertase